MEFPKAVRVRSSSSPGSREGRGGHQLGSNLECQRAQLRVLMRHKNPAGSGMIGAAENMFVHVDALCCNILGKNYFGFGSYKSSLEKIRDLSCPVASLENVIAEFVVVMIFTLQIVLRHPWI
ncbi:uncharacterized protein A4U43_C07F11750 [Asparagus officinalis]|uniref:Uncharacterized protein n=1 Tax=Asparagus officinalis TaxID=4686 RepID=A0A5P1EBI6_ASPOF|nr:uncharacterized protein A4U43_C07F11750 [Asparagus officinalis]